MTLTNKLLHIGFALSVGTLGFLAVNVEPAQAQRLDSVHNSQNSAKTYCETMLKLRNMNHFYGSVEDLVDHRGTNNGVQVRGYILHEGNVYSVGSLFLNPNKTVRTNEFCQTLRKVGQLDNQKQEFVSGGCWGELGCSSGGYKTTLWTQEDQFKDLALYSKWKENKVEKTVYRNLDYMNFKINFGGNTNNGGPARVNMNQMNGWRQNAFGN